MSYYSGYTFGNSNVEIVAKWPQKIGSQIFK